MSRKSRKSSRPTQPATGLPPAFPSAPGRNGTYVLYIKRDSQFISAQIFCAEYAAQKFIDLLVDDNEVMLETDTLMKAGRLTIKCDRLKRVRDHGMTTAEKEWELPVPYPTIALRLRLGETFEPETPGPMGDAPAPRTKSPKKERKPRASRDDLVGIADIAKAVGITPREARGLLRKSDLTKPDAGWAWPEGDEVDKVKAVLTA